jgi:hypothetical protein
MDLDRYDENQATTMLVLIYLKAFGPATVNDIAWWIGTKKSRALKALAGLKDETRERSKYANWERDTPGSTLN